jgi:hypothetical protein
VLETFLVPPPEVAWREGNGTGQFTGTWTSIFPLQLIKLWNEVSVLVRCGCQFAPGKQQNKLDYSMPIQSCVDSLLLPRPLSGQVSWMRCFYYITSRYGNIIFLDTFKIKTRKKGGHGIHLKLYGNLLTLDLILKK